MLPHVPAERERLIVGLAEGPVLAAPLVSLVALMGLDQFALSHFRLLPDSIRPRTNVATEAKFLTKCVNWISPQARDRDSGRTWAARRWAFTVEDARPPGRSQAASH
jgi:hypothetical protein